MTPLPVIVDNDRFSTPNFFSFSSVLLAAFSARTPDEQIRPAS